MPILRLRDFGFVILGAKPDLCYEGHVSFQAFVKIVTHENELWGR